MIDRIIHFSIYNKLIVLLFVFGLVGWGVYSVAHLAIDAVPDITDNQVQIITSTPDLSAQEVERLITYPLELEMGNIPRVDQIRSISRFGLSVITVVFEEQVDIYWARQQIHQRIQLAKDEIPDGLGTPEMGPVSTGLGEIYQYVLYPKPGYEDQYDATELRGIQDWIIKRQLIGIPGVIEVNSSGGFLKQYEVAINQSRLQAYNLSLAEVIEAVEKNNENTGGSYIEKKDYTYFIRGEGMIEKVADLENVLARHTKEGPILIRDIAAVRIGHAPRFGAVTMNGRGEVVAGRVMMLKGANSMEVTRRVKERMSLIEASLPAGIVVEPYLDRSKLINRTTKTVIKNLIEGALIVVFILVLFLGNFRAGLIVASVIPLSMLFAISMMRIFGVSANLMSLGAIDFGLIVDGAVIIVESILHNLTHRKKAIQNEDLEFEVYKSAGKIRKSAAFGEIIILFVYLPILFLEGVEGKMFRPMAQTVTFAILGALILSLTYVPMMSARFLKNSRENERSLSARFIAFLQKFYQPLLRRLVKVSYLFLALVLAFFVSSLLMLNRMGAEFIPTLEEGDFALHQILPAGSSIRKGVEVSARLQDILMQKFPEVVKVVTQIGTAEIPIDIMPIEAGDIFVIMKPKSEWTSASSREEMFEKMEEELSRFPGVIYEFTQPIQMRFNELMTGIRQDIAIKIYGEDLGELYNLGKRVEYLLQNVKGTGDIQVEPTGGLQQMVVKYDRLKLATYGLSISDASDQIKSAFAGRIAGNFYEGERKFDIVVRYETSSRENLESLAQLMVPLPMGGYTPMSELASINFEEGPAQISRDDTKRRITIGVNARATDIASLIDRIKMKLDAELDMPPGYHIRFGGQFENLERARSRLSVVVPVALILIFILLYLTFNSVKYAALIYVAIPLSAIGGIWALYLREMPFSISAAVGFIALFGVAVLNGIILVGYFNQLKKEGIIEIDERIMIGTKVRLRPVLLTAAVASLGFLPMALSTSAGAEVQRPLATVVIGGLITATILTLFVIPLLYRIIEGWSLPKKGLPILLMGLASAFLIPSLRAQTQKLTIDQAINIALENNDQLESRDLEAEAYLKRAEEPLAPLPLSLSVSGEEFDFNNSGIQSLNVGKSFRIAKSKSAYANYFRGQGNLINGKKMLDRQQLARQVAKDYLIISYHKSHYSLEAERATAYRTLLRISDRKVQLGESGSLPARQAKIRLGQSEMKLQRLEQLVDQGLLAFATWFDFDPVDIEALEEIELDIETVGKDEHPKIQELDLAKNLLGLQNEIMVNDFKPTVFTVLRFQSVAGSFPFFGFQAGVNIPIGGKYLANQMKANHLNLQSIEVQKLFVQQQINRQSQWRRNQIETLAQQLGILRDNLILEAEQTLLQYEMAFRQGMVSYLEVIGMQDSLFNLREEYLESLSKYLSEIIQLKFIEISTP